jgi:BirA family biotin operon repressor/biotin-[acetyl-CoA-carboxylase] ligase
LPQQPSHTDSKMPFIELQSVDSTNNYALARIHAGLAQDKEVIFAHEQVAGKGQRGRQWDSGKGVNIISSFIVKQPSIPLSRQFELSACAAVAVHDFFSQYAGEDSKIKWPNDLFWQDRKAGGILIESVIGSQASAKKKDLAEAGAEQQEASWQWAVAGIGININQTSFPAHLKNPVSLKQITGRTFDTITLTKELSLFFHQWLKTLYMTGFEHILSRYNEQLYKREQKVKLKKENRIFEALIKSVLPTGELVIEHSIEEKIEFGQVEWVL